MFKSLVLYSSNGRQRICDMAPATDIVTGLFVTGSKQSVILGETLTVLPHIMRIV